MHETAELLSNLVRLPSVNPMGRPLEDAILYEHRVTDYLEQFFRNLSVPWERQPVAPLRENILARYDSPGAERTILWEVHQDTVPVDRMAIDPFGAEIKNGRLYGRGACDVKGGMASMLAAFARLVREKPRGTANIVLACTVDEEHTFLGAQKLAEGAKQSFLAECAIVAEPTLLHIVKAHKGSVRWTLSTSGRSCHSSRPQDGINAIYHMARVLPFVEEYAQKLQSSKTDDLLGPATLSVGRIEGGVSVNTVPDACSVEIDRRTIPGEDYRAAPEDLSTYLRAHVPEDVPWSCAKPWQYCPSLSANGSEEIIERLGQAIDKVVGSHEVQAVPYGTDASTIAEAGIPAVVFGPGDIAMAHTCDESVELDQLEKASEILYHLAIDQ